MNKIKRISLVLMSALLLIPMSACSADKSWAAKNDSLTVPIGCYISYLYSEYETAASKVSDTSKAVLSQKVDGKNAETWIREKALSDTKELFVIDAKMKELNLKLTTAEETSLSNTVDSSWEQNSTSFEKWGIAKSSFSTAFYERSAKSEKLFNAIYGKGGTKAVSDANLKTYFEKNYSDFSFVIRPLYTTDSSGSISGYLSDDEKKKAEAEFNGYADKIKAGTMTMQQAADAYKKTSSSSTDQLNSATVNLDSSNYPNDMKTMIKGMKAGEVKAGEISSTYYIVVLKNDISKKTDEKLKNSSSRTTILYSDKGTEFTEGITKEASALKNVTVNETAINSYNPSMFVTETSSQAASSTAS